MIDHSDNDFDADLVNFQEDHTDLVARLKKDDHQMYLELQPGDCDVAHMILGVGAESGELMTAAKSYLFYRKPLDRVNVIEEMGDLEFYLEGLRQRWKISRDEVLAANIEKLNRRFVEGVFSNAEAIERKDKK